MKGKQVGKALGTGIFFEPCLLKPEGLPGSLSESVAQPWSWRSDGHGDDRTVQSRSF